MALLLEKETQYGITASYWKIVQLNINCHLAQAHVDLAGFKDHQARLDGKAALEGVAFDWQGEDFPFSDDVNNRQAAYEKIKTLEGWELAQDV